MGIIGDFFSPPKKPRLDPDRTNELKQLEQAAYFEKAKTLAKAKGEKNADDDYSTKPKKQPWDLN